MGHEDNGPLLPSFAWVGLTSRCNLNCAHCQRMHLRAQGVLKPRNMPVEVFDKIEAQLLPHLKRIQFGGNNFGEPLLIPNWDDVFERISRFGLRISVVSNGSLLNSQRIAAMVRAGVEFNFSLEGAKPETYERIRGCGFDEFCAFVEETCRTRDQSPDCGARVNLGFTARRDNIEEVAELLSLSSRLGVDRLTITHFVPWAEEQRLLSLVYHKELANEQLALARREAQSRGLLLDLPALFPLDGGPPAVDVAGSNGCAGQAPCLLPWNSVSINENGDVMPCCATSVVLGNLKCADFHEIWNGRRYRKLRDTVNTPRPLRFCAGCGLRGIEIGADHALSFPSDEAILLGGIGTEANGKAPSGLRRVKQIITRRRWARRVLPTLTEFYRRHAAFLRVGK